MLKKSYYASVCMISTTELEEYSHLHTISWIFGCNARAHRESRANIRNISIESRAIYWHSYNSSKNIGLDSVIEAPY